jgi:hypothetical protein
MAAILNRVGRSGKLIAEFRPSGQSTFAQWQVIGWDIVTWIRNALPKLTRSEFVMPEHMRPQLKRPLIFSESEWAWQQLALKCSTRRPRE